MKKLFSIFILLITLLGIIGCARQVSSWREIEGAKAESVSDESMKLVFNVDNDSITQFERLSDENKINYVAYWCGTIPTNLQIKTGATYFSQATKAVYSRTQQKYTVQEKVVFYFNKGNKFTILISAVRGSKW